MRDLPRQLTRRGAGRPLRGPDALRRAARGARRPARTRPRGRGEPLRRGEAGGARRASRDRRRSGSRPARPPSRARDEAPELDELNRALRGAVRLPLRRLRERRPKRELVAVLRGAARAHARAGARDRRSTSSSRSRRTDGGVPSARATTGGAGATSSSAGCTWSPGSPGSAPRSTSSRSTTTSSRPPSRPTPRAASAARSGRSTAAASTGSRSSASRPERLPEPLYWFKWEAYTTWLSGFALLVVVYYAHASSFLVDPSVADLTTGEAIAISVGGLALAWLVYDGLCRLLGGNDRALAACRRRASSCSRPGAPPSCSRPGPPTSRSARCSGRSWRRTSSS